jgi:hypothetical protein
MAATKTIVLITGGILSYSITVTLKQVLIE